MGRLNPRPGHATAALAIIAAAFAALWLMLAAKPGITMPRLDWLPQRDLSHGYVVRIDLAEIELKKAAPQISAPEAEDSGEEETAAPEAASLSSALVGPANMGPERQPAGSASPDALDLTQADLENLDFELGVGERLTEKKPAIYGGKVYSVGIRIDSGGRISARVNDLAEIFGKERVKLLACCVDKAGYAEFADVRAAGISVAYDPTADQIVLD